MSRRSRLKRKDKAGLVEIKITPPTLTDLMDLAPCVVCGSRESLRRQEFNPTLQQSAEMGATPGKIRLVPYNLCPTCSEQEAERIIYQQMVSFKPPPSAPGIWALHTSRTN